jgi:glycosyltransferase involved in cell wall biosynthesis
MGKHILIIAPYPPASAPSQRFRFEQYLPYLKEQGYTVTMKPFLSEKGWNKLYKEGSNLAKVMTLSGSFMRRWGLVFSLAKYDHIFIHREASMVGPAIFEWIIAKVFRRKFIYDFDDAIWLPNYSDSNARFQKLKMYKKVHKIMRLASTITVGNKYLEEYAAPFNNNVRVIPTTIDTANVHNQEGNPNNEIPVVGWTGSHTTMQYLDELIPVLDELSNEVNFKFRVISNQPMTIERDYLEFTPWNAATEIQDLASINIGVMPLTDNEWSRGKCGFKALQYMSLGIPAVVSPVGVNTTIISHGDSGFICSNPDEWKKTLKDLLNKSELRRSIGQKGKERVLDAYSVEANKDFRNRKFEQSCRDQIDASERHRTFNVKRPEPKGRHPGNGPHLGRQRDLEGELCG